MNKLTIVFLLLASIACSSEEPGEIIVGQQEQALNRADSEDRSGFARSCATIVYSRVSLDSGRTYLGPFVFQDVGFLQSDLEPDTVHPGCRRFDGVPRFYRDMNGKVCDNRLSTQELGVCLRRLSPFPVEIARDRLNWRESVLPLGCKVSYGYNPNTNRITSASGECGPDYPVPNDN